MASLRESVGNSLPPRWANAARRVVRGLDQLAGWPTSHLRPGAIAMYHVGRCGSSVLGGLLDQHPGIRWDREIYFHRYVASDRTFAPWDSETFLRRRMWSSGRRFYGYEIKFLAGQHLKIVGRPLAEYVAEAARAGVTHHVVLERRNGLRRMISQVRGVRSETRHVRVGEAPPETGAVQLPVDRIRFWRFEPFKTLVDCLDEIADGYAELRRELEGQTVLDLTFEDDVAADPQAAFGRVCDFLGLPRVDAEVHTRRLHAKPVSELVANYDEVEAALRGTRHEWMLDD